MGCVDDVACVAEIGAALGVDAVLTGEIGKLGKTYVVTSSLVHITQARALVRGIAKSTETRWR